MKQLKNRGSRGNPAEAFGQPSEHGVDGAIPFRGMDNLLPKRFRKLRKNLAVASFAVLKHRASRNSPLLIPNRPDSFSTVSRAALIHRARATHWETKAVRACPPPGWVRAGKRPGSRPAAIPPAMLPRGQRRRAQPPRSVAQIAGIDQSRIGFGRQTVRDRRCNSRCG